MNDKSQNQSRQDREELLVTSSTSSPSNAIDTPPTTVSTPSSSPTSTTAAVTTTSSLSSSSLALCQAVTSSTENSTVRLQQNREQLDEDDDDDVVIVSDANDRPPNSIDEASNNSKLISRPDEMGGSPSTDGETCIVIPSSSRSNSYLEQSKDNNRNMLLTMRSTESDSNAESGVKAATSVVSTPTTRSKRKLMNSEAGASGLTTPVANNRSSTNVNNSKAVSVDIKNHQLPVTTTTTSTAKKKANSVAVSINSCQGVDAKVSKGGKNIATLKGSEEKEENCNAGGSNKRNCVNTTTVNAVESQCEQSPEAVTNCVGIEDVVTDNRKVEPLKINLNRDVKTKITIKPLPKPQAETDSDDAQTIKCNSPSPSSSDSSSSSSCIETSSTPKTLPNQNCVDSQQQQQQHPEPHIVPKLTIRASDCNSSSSSSLTNFDVKHSVVPKLTIKMDGAMNCVKDSLMLAATTLPLVEHGSTQPPLPKLTIKTSGDTTESVISSSMLASPPISGAQPTVPKLTIKNISKTSSTTTSLGNCSSDQPTIPKFTIKSSLTAQLSPVSTNATIDGDSSGHHSAEVSQTNSPIPKLTIKAVSDSEANSSSLTVPKLKIRTKADDEVAVNESTLSPTIPKFTIKSIKENEHKLTIAVNDRVESPMSQNDTLPKLTVVRQEDSSNERVPKLTISLQDSPKVCRTQHESEKLPKLTIKAVSDAECEEGIVPKLTIKTVSEPEMCERIPKITIKAKSESIGSESVEKVPKLTIKTVTDSTEMEEKCEKIPKLTIKAIADEEVACGSDRVPKLTIKTIAETHEFERMTRKFAAEQQVEKEKSDDAQIPKLTIKQIAEVMNAIGDNHDQSDSNRIPKLTIKSISDTDPIETVDLTTTHEEKIPKLKIKSQTIAVSKLTPTAADKIPKLTIRTKSTSTAAMDAGEPADKRQKLIVQQSSTTATLSANADENERIPKLTIKHIANNIDDEMSSTIAAATSSSSSPSACLPLSPKVPKLTINNHGAGKHLKRSGRRKKPDDLLLVAAVDEDSRSNDSSELTIMNESRTEEILENVAAVKEPDLIADELERLFQGSPDADDDMDIAKSEVEENSRGSTKDTIQSDARNESNRRLEMELEQIRSQNDSSSSKKLSESLNDSNLEISADLSDAAINDLVDILNDDLGAADTSPGQSNAAHHHPSHEEGSRLEAAEVEVAIAEPKPSEDEADIKSNIPDDIVSLESDENDIVDQLTELLNEATDANEIDDQILLSTNSSENSMEAEPPPPLSSSSSSVECGKQDASDVVEILDDDSSKKGEPVAGSSISEPKIVPIEEGDGEEDAISELPVSTVNEDKSSSNGLMESLLNYISGVETGERVDMPNSNSGTSLLHSALTRSMVEDSNSNMTASNMADLVVENNLNVVDSIDLISDDEIEMSELIPSAAETAADVAAVANACNILKRHASDNIIVSPKKLRSDSSDNSSTMNQLTMENSMDSDIMIVQETSCPPAIMSKQSTSSLIDLESSSLTGDETFRTLTELKTIDAHHANDRRTRSILEKDEEEEEEEDDSTSLKEILTKLQEEHDSASNVTQTEIKQAERKSTEPVISVIQSSPPHSNSTQSILLINEESGSADDILTERDPLMIEPGSLQQQLDHKIEDVEAILLGDTIQRMPLKRPRGRPRKDGKPAGSVKKPEPGIRKRRAMQLEDQNSQNSVIKHRPRSLFTEGGQLIENNLAATASSPSSRIPVISPAKNETGSRSPSPPPELSSLMQSPETPMKRPTRGRGRGGRGSARGGSARGCGRGRGSRGGRGRCIGGLTHTPEKRPHHDLFFTPENNRKLEVRTSLQVFEEDTRMSADSLTTPNRQSNDLLTNNNDENTQSSMLSSSSILDGSSNTTTANTHERKKRSKMEVFAPEGKTEYTVDMICEYDWPPPKGCCPARNRDTFMIQEQIAQYLGIKSFKRKYPDLPRRQIDMEERNYLQEKCLVTEKMCDLGITAVWASDILDIMYTDFYEKYEEYKAYLREKQLRDIEAKQKAQAAEAVDKSLQARERAMASASKWNNSFNKSRRDERRLCLDLQNLVINLPASVGRELSRPYERDSRPPSHYPIALVPGQFSENYRVYSSEELRRYPINTILESFDDEKSRLSIKHNESDDESTDASSDGSSSCDSDSDSSSSSISDSETSSSSSDEESEPPDHRKLKCSVCHQLQNRNRRGFPERFIQCVTCRKQIHPSCIEMPTRMVHRARNYNWQCVDCKCCIKCKRKTDQNKMLYCEQCDRGFHIYCIQIKNVPDGHWSCERCAVCIRCGATKPEGNLPPPPPNPNQRPSRKRAKWANEHRLDPITQLREHWSIMCVPCSRQRTRSRPTMTTTQQ